MASNYLQDCDVNKNIKKLPPNLESYKIMNLRSLLDKRRWIYTQVTNKLFIFIIQGNNHLNHFIKKY